jgi:hypothetical protein
MVSIQNWLDYTNTYKVKILDDMISTGKISSSEDTIEDYYTIIQQNKEYKLNINAYIGKANINNVGQTNGITITVLTKNVYKEYEEYNIKIENTTSQTISLDSQENGDSMYLLGANEAKYKAYSYELDQTNLCIQPNETKTITIRFNKIYSNTVNIEQLVFSDIILNYEEYSQSEDKTQYVNRANVSIDI